MGATGTRGMRGTGNHAGRSGRGRKADLLREARRLRILASPRWTIAELEEAIEAEKVRRAERAALPPTPPAAPAPRERRLLGPAVKVLGAPVLATLLTLFYKGYESDLAHREARLAALGESVTEARNAQADEITANDVTPYRSGNDNEAEARRRRAVSLMDRVAKRVAVPDVQRCVEELDHEINAAVNAETKPAAMSANARAAHIEKGLSGRIAGLEGRTQRGFWRALRSAFRLPAEDPGGGPPTCLRQ